MLRKKRVCFLLFTIIILCTSFIILNSKESTNICIINSDSIESDSEIVYLDANFNIKKNIQIPARDIISSCNKKSTVLLPTASDNKLFEAKKNGTVKSSETDLGGNYIKCKGNELLTLSNQ